MEENKYQELLRKAKLLEDASKNTEDEFLQKSFKFKSQQLKDKANNLFIGEVSHA